MAMSPNQFRGKRQKIEQLINRTNLYMQGLTEDGLWIPITSYNDVTMLIDELNRGIGSIQECLSGLQTNSPKRELYMQDIHNAEACLLQLKEIAMDFIKPARF